MLHLQPRLWSRKRQRSSRFHIHQHPAVGLAQCFEHGPGVALVVEACDELRHAVVAGGQVDDHAWAMKAFDGAGVGCAVGRGVAGGEHFANFADASERVVTSASFGGAEDHKLAAFWGHREV